MIKTDYIILGQGIAGSTLALALEARGKTLAIIDNAHQNSSSMRAAGTVNPITGRRYVKTWLADTVIPYAKDYYRKAEETLDIPIFYDRNIAFVFSSVAMQNDWLLRAEEPNSEYIADKSEQLIYTNTLHDVIDTVEFCKAGRVDMPMFINTCKKNALKKHHYIETAFDYNALEISPDFVRYQDVEAKAVIFCEGAQAASKNPYFNYLPFNLAKGEILLVKIPNYPLADKLLKHKQLFIIQVQPDIYWVGSSYIRDISNDQPTAAEGAYLEQQLREILRLPFEIVGHQAGIRPTVKDRRPFLGRHPKHHNLFIFNGLGAKGSYLAPYFAEHLVQYILDGKALMPEVDIHRI